MLRFTTAAAAVLGLAVAFTPVAMAASHMDDGSRENGAAPMNKPPSKKDRGATGTATEDKVIVVDAPDIRKVPKGIAEPRFTKLIGEDVYSNTGKKIGKVEDFILTSGGEMYAVIDTSDGPLESLLDMGNDDLVVLPLRELRRAARPTSKPAGESRQRSGK